MNNPIYKYAQVTTTLPDTAVCGAELEIETFYLSVSGVKSILTVDLEVTYKQGDQEDITSSTAAPQQPQTLRLRRMLHEDSWFAETALGEDDDDVDYAAMERKPEERSLSAEFSIFGREENMVGVMLRKMSKHPRSTGFVFFGFVLAALTMNAFKTKSSAYVPLVEDF